MSDLSHTSCHDPEDLGRLFAERLNARDLDGLVCLYEDGATLVSPDGANASGERAIRRRLEEMLAWSAYVLPVDSRALVSDDIALISHRWTLAAAPAAEDRQAEELHETEEEALGSGALATSTEVARRQPDGSWRYVIDDPASSIALGDTAR